MRASYARIRDLGLRVLHAQETERSRIARRHDDIGQQIALLAINLQLLSAAEAACGSLVTNALSRAQCVARSLHDLSHRVHPAKLGLIGLIPCATRHSSASSRNREWPSS